MIRKTFFFSCLACLLFSLEGFAQTFAIDPAQSEIRILVYRDGALSGLAHDHVIVSSKIDGMVQLDASDVSRSSIELNVPLRSLIVDDPKHRAQEKGDGFSSPLSEEDVSDIRKTMLSEDVLDANAFPKVTVTSVAVTGQLPTLNVTANLSIHGQFQKISVPTEVQLQNQQLIASGSVSLKQTDFGIEPISLFLGTIKVKDELLVKFKITGLAK